MYVTEDYMCIIVFESFLIINLWAKDNKWLKWQRSEAGAEVLAFAPSRVSGNSKEVFFNLY